jgi:hypothetical protein
MENCVETTGRWGRFKGGSHWEIAGNGRIV